MLKENNVHITAKIKGVEYIPFLGRDLKEYDFNEFDKALDNDATFILNLNEKNKIAVSWWVSAKRTRSYPYSRVYDSLDFSSKKITIIPIFKDEGKEGDRDYLQWDTISLMSLLGVYVIIAYYNDAVQSSRYDQKITSQRFDIKYLNENITKLRSYQSDALHWNIAQIDRIGEIGDKAIKSYKQISENTGVEMHSLKAAKKRINNLREGKESFMELSRNLAELAQRREQITEQPKELLNGIKGTITITNYLGGNYYFTSDEVELHGEDIYLIDAKHTRKNNIPSLGDIKDGLLKMMLFTNLSDVKINGKNVKPVAVLKLTTGDEFSIEELSSTYKKRIEILKKEASVNGFKILLNSEYLC
ncbi:hypothetical protein GF327_00840 [Candidatus Woesearchaeota archaeon]|nr:hypothetical protein [Candidatus Woesearchaeota archaeon]